MPEVVRIHSNVAETGNYNDRRGIAAVALYYYCRAMDTKGAGQVTISLADAAATLEKSVPTIKRYLVDGLKLGFFRSVHQEGDTATVYYAGLKKVALLNGLDKLGAVAELPVSELKNLKFWAVQLTAQALQESSRWLARHATKKNVLQAENILEPSCSNSQRESGVLHVGSRCAFVDSGFIMFGVSIQHLAEVTGRGAATIQRRLCNHYRAARNVTSVQKKQLARKIPVEHQKQSHELVSHFPGINKLFACKGTDGSHGAFQYGCNIYEREFDILSARTCKYGFRLLFESSLT